MYKDIKRTMNLFPKEVVKLKLYWNPKVFDCSILKQGRMRMFGKKISKTASVLTLVLVFLGVVAFPTMAKEWNQYLNGPQHRSYINITGLQNEPELKWQYEIIGEPGNPVIADDGTVYVSSARNYFGEENAAAKNISDLHLYAFDKNGTLKFDKVLLTMISNTDVFSTVAPFELAIGNNGAIFAVSYDPNNQKGYIYSFDASGNINWEKTYDNISLSGEPVISTNNTIYVTAGTNMLYAFNGNNGAEYWNTDIGGGYLHGCTLSNDETVLYAGNEWGTVKAIDAAGGNTIWSIDNMHTDKTPVVAHDGSLLIANNYYNVLCMLNPATGVMLSPAELKQGAGLGGEPAVNKDNEAIALEWKDGKVSCYSIPTGQQNWTVSDIGTPYRSPIVDANSNVYFGAQSNIYALNAAGQLLWQKSIIPNNDGYRYMASNMIMNQSGSICFAACDSYNGKNYFVCYGASGANPPVESVEAPVFSPSGGTYTAAQQVSISSATSGATIHYTTDGTEPSDNSNIYIAPIQVGHSLTIKAKASKAGMNDSITTSASFSINIPVDPDAIVLANHWISGAAFDFTRGKAFSFWEGNPEQYSDDLELVGNPAAVMLRGNLIDMGSTTLDQLITPPVSGYGSEIPAVSGHAYWAKVGDSYYKFAITNIDLTTDANGNVTSMTFKYQKYSALPEVRAPELKLAEITTKGDLSLTFDLEMANPSGTHNQFAVEVDGSKVPVTAVENTNTPTKIKLVLQNKVIGAKKISIKYTRGEAAGEQLKSLDGRIVDSFIETWEEWTSPGSKPSYQPWTIKFSLDVDPSSVIDNNIYILDKNGIKLAASLSMPDNKTVSLTPKTLYTSGERYILYISKAVRSAVGGRTYLKDNIHMKFTVVPGT